LTAILAATHRNPWYEYAAVATAGSVIGAYLTFKIARRAGSAYLHSKFGYRKLDVILSFFHKWGTGAIAVSTAVPFPWPTSVLFAAAGASNYGVGRRGRMVDGPEIENSGPQCCSVSGNLRLVCEVGEVESKLLRIMSLMCDQLRRILAPHPPARALAASAFSGNCSQAGLHLAG